MRPISAHTRDLYAIWNDGRGKKLVAIACGWFLSIGMMAIYPVVLPEIRVAFDLNLTVAGFLVTALWFVYGLGQLPAGYFTDWLGEGSIMALSTLLAGVAAVLVAASRSRVMLFGATVSLGLSTSLYGIARFTAMDHIFPERIGIANGLVDAAADGGQTLLPVVAGLLTGAIAWQYGIAFTMPLFVLTAATIRLSVPARTGSDESAVDIDTSVTREVLSEMRRPALFYGSLVFLIATAVWMTFMSFYPTYLVEQKGLSSSAASGLFGLFFGLGIVLKPVAGTLYDRIGIRSTFVAIVVVASIGMASLPFAEGVLPLVGSTICVASLNGYNPPVVSHLTTALPDRIAGTGLGVIRTITIAISALSPVVFGAIADRGLFDEGFLLLATLLFCLSIPLFRIPGGADSPSTDSGREELDHGQS